MEHALTQPEFTAWLDGYKRAWEERDPAAAAALFTSDATYRETPFDDVLAGTEAIRAYWTKAVSGQSDVQFTYELLACAGDEGFCRWHAAFTGVPGGEAIDLDGIFRCRFADEHHVRTFEEWWHIRIVPAA
jgi:uncharacterized protein (TIGR02246 family)